MHLNEALIRRRYELLARRDLDSLVQLLSDDVAWHVPGRNPLAGDYRGRAQVIELFSKLLNLTGETARVGLEDVLANDRFAVALEAGTAGRGKRRVSTRNVTVYRIEEGRIAEVWFHPSDQYVLDAFWS
jgi:uncharacterized protein